MLCLSQAVRDDTAEFIKHTHGSHVARTLLHVLAGCVGPPRTDSRPGIDGHTLKSELLHAETFMLTYFVCVTFFQGAKDRNVTPQLTDFEAPTSFWYELKSLTETLMNNVNGESPFTKLQHIYPPSKEEFLNYPKENESAYRADSASLLKCL